jgi:hypothetical protein
MVVNLDFVVVCVNTMIVVSIDYHENRTRASASQSSYAPSGLDAACFRTLCSYVTPLQGFGEDPIGFGTKKPLFSIQVLTFGKNVFSLTMLNRKFVSNMVAQRSSIGIEQVQTIKPGGAKGVKIDTNTYLAVSRSIFEHLSRNDEVTIVDLLSRIEDDFQDLNKENGNFIYIALHVKLDLEGRGYLKLSGSKANPGQVQKCIRMTKRGWEYFKAIRGKEN